MIDIKVNLVIAVPGATLMSEQECSKRLKKFYSKGKNWKWKKVPDPEKCNYQELKVLGSKDPKTKEVLQIYTRKCYDAIQVINLSRECFTYYTSNEVPEEYEAPKNFKINKKLASEGIGTIAQAWRALSVDDKLMWHFNRIANDLGGIVESYKIFDD